MTGGEGTIVVRGISFVASHGATEEERRGKRRFEVDVEIETSLGRAAQTDELSDTIDYGRVCELVVATGTERTYRLLEAVAAAILRRLGERYPEAGIKVEVRKLAPPIAGTPAYTSVRVGRPPRYGKTASE